LKLISGTKIFAVVIKKTMNPKSEKEIIRGF